MSIRQSLLTVSLSPIWVQGNFPDLLFSIENLYPTLTFSRKHLDFHLCLRLPWSLPGMSPFFPPALRCWSVRSNLTPPRQLFRGASAHGHLLAVGRCCLGLALKYSLPARRCVHSYHRLPVARFLPVTFTNDRESTSDSALPILVSHTPFSPLKVSSADSLHRPPRPQLLGISQSAV